MVEQIKSFLPDSTDPPLSDEHRENIQRPGRVCHSVSGVKNGEIPLLCEYNLSCLMVKLPKSDTWWEIKGKC